MKVVIPAAGLGTRMLPATKEQPKEMLPIFSRSSSNSLCLIPVLQMVFDQLYAFGFREFCFIIGRGKRAIEDYFTPDNGNLYLLRNRGKNSAALELEKLYQRILSSKIIWINQPEPRGFGDAVLHSECVVGADDLLVHAGDTYIVSKGTHLQRLRDIYDKFKADAVFAVKRVSDPRQFGVIRCVEVEANVFRVTDAVEKPAEPPTNLAIMPIYLFKPRIFEFLKRAEPDDQGEFQLTDGIKGMIDAGLNVLATSLEDGELWLDIGTPDLYWEALRTSFDLSKLPE